MFGGYRRYPPPVYRFICGIQPAFPLSRLPQVQMSNLHVYCRYLSCFFRLFSHACFLKLQLSILDTRLSQSHIT